MVPQESPVRAAVGGNRFSSFQNREEGLSYVRNLIQQLSSTRTFFSVFGRFLAHGIKQKHLPMGVGIIASRNPCLHWVEFMIAGDTISLRKNAFQFLPDHVEILFEF